MLSASHDNFKKWSCACETGDTDHRKLLETRKLGLHSLQHVGVIFTLFSFLDPQQIHYSSSLEEGKRQILEVCIVVFPSYYELKFLVTAKSVKQMKYTSTFPLRGGGKVRE